MKTFIFLLFFALRSLSSEGFRILGVFPHPAISHFRAFQPLLVELAALGHDVVVVSHFPDTNAPDNYRDLVLDQSDIMTSTASVEEVSAIEILCYYFCAVS
jgi:glucuronosyltransferase